MFLMLLFAQLGGLKDQEPRSRDEFFESSINATNLHLLSSYLSERRASDPVETSNPSS